MPEHLNFGRGELYRLNADGSTTLVAKVESMSLSIESEPMDVPLSAVVSAAFPIKITPAREVRRLLKLPHRLKRASGFVCRRARRQ